MEERPRDAMGAAGASGLGGTGIAGVSGSPPTAGVAGCTRGEDCTASIAVDDVIGSYCVTKVSGAHRCWKDGDVYPGVLPEARYRRVQLSALGLVGLTEDGTVVTAPEVSLPMGSLAGVSDFQATNMWGGIALCALADSVLTIYYLRRSDQVGEPDPLFPEPRPVSAIFRQAVCAYEGLVAGVNTDGSLYSIIEPAPPSGNDFTKVALSMYVLCALRGEGSVACARSYVDRVCQAPLPRELCDVVPTPAIEGDSWKDLAVTYTVVCALDLNGELSCRNLLGTEVLRDEGPYTSIEAGKNVVCALRAEGTTACFGHALPDGSVHVEALSPLTLDANW